MITQLLKLGALVATGRFLKPRLKGLLWVAASWLALWFIHSEFVSYVQLTGDTDLVLHASLLKTVFYALSIAVYVLLVERKLWPKPVHIPPAASTPKHKPTPPLPTRPSGPPLIQPDDDGFNFLRDKPSLRK